MPIRLPKSSAASTIDAAIRLTEVAPEAPYGKAIGSFHRGFEVLELFAVEQRSLRVGEVASRLNYPQSSTSVLLRGLAELGYLQHDRRARTYLPTLRVSFLGMWLHQNALSQGSLLEFMETLASQSGQVAMLGVQNGLYAQYIHIVSARSSRVGLKPGLLRPICRSAVGKVLLSAMSDADIRRILRNANAVETNFATPVVADELMVDIAECRRTGFAYSIDAVNEGASVIATRVPLEIGGQPLAVGIGVHTRELPKIRGVVIDLLRESIATYFQATSPELGRSHRNVRAPQVGYSIVKKS